MTIASPGVCIRDPETEPVCDIPPYHRLTRAAYLEHDAAKLELKKLMPEDAKEAIGHGVRARRSKSGAISFDQIEAEAGHAAL